MLDSPLQSIGLGTRDYAIYDGLLSETTDLIRQTTTKPDSTRANLINTCIQSLKTAGVWDKLGILYLYAAGDNQISRLNWKNPGTFTAFGVNSPTFTTDRGYAGNGTSSYIGLAVAPSTIPNFSQNNASIFAVESTTTASAGAILGMSGGPGSGLGAISMTCRNSSSKAGATLNAVTGITTVASVPSTGSILTLASRADSANVSVYTNGSLVESQANTSAGISSTTLCLGRTNTTYTSKLFAAMGAGAALTATEQLALYNAIQTYLNAIGAW